jgi:hypothetical protein
MSLLASPAPVESTRQLFPDTRNNLAGWRGGGLLTVVGSLEKRPFSWVSRDGKAPAKPRAPDDRTALNNALT